MSAIRSGAVTITASQDGSSATSGLTVVRGDFIPSADATLGGVLEVATLTVAAGVTITLTAGAVIDAQGPVVIAGNVVGDCKGLSLNGQADVTISGTFSNACSATSADTEPPDLVILGSGAVNLDGATVTSSGDITIGNSVVAAASAAPGLSAAVGVSTVSLRGTMVTHDPLFAPPGLDGATPGAGQDGHHIILQPAEILFLDGTTLQAQHGGPGGSSEVEGTAETIVSRGGDGGAGGHVELVPIEIVSLSLVSLEPITVQIGGGDGGAGGSGTSTALWDVQVGLLPHANSFGGDGGAGGNAFTQDSFFDVFVDIEIGGTVQLNPGDGGVGGNGSSVGVDGDFTFLSGPDFGIATAMGGAGGHSGVALVGPDFLTGTAQGGPGGFANAMGINGPDGDDILGGPGFPGGAATGVGGLGGNGFGVPGAPGGDVILWGGNGGNAGPNCPVINLFDFDGTIRVTMDTELSDFFMFNAGSKGIPLGLSGANVGEGGGPGFAAGDGGDLFGTPGLPGFDLLNPGSLGPPGTLFIGPGGNGGDMGRGLSPGSGGMAGSGPAGSFTPVGEIFTDGFESGDVSAWSCSTPAPARTAGQETAAAVVVTQATPGTMTLTGTGACVTVTGEIAEDGTITAEGVGTVAGTDNISVSFSGTFDEGAGTLSGDYSMDTGSAISPGHPVVYELDLVVTPPAATAGGPGGD